LLEAPDAVIKYNNFATNGFGIRGCTTCTCTCNSSDEREGNSSSSFNQADFALTSQTYGTENMQA